MDDNIGNELIFMLESGTYSDIQSIYILVMKYSFMVLSNVKEIRKGTLQFYVLILPAPGVFVC